jgi:hypothetical protein
LRAITELWQQLRIIPVVSAPGAQPKWQLLRTRFQKAIAEGASTSQVTAISVLASIYLQAVIAASMEEVEMFLAPLTARSKVREVLRGLVATRQVHSISLGHAPHFYVAGTLPEFAAPPALYTSSSMPASAYFLSSRDREDDMREVEAPKSVFNVPPPPIHPSQSGEVHALRASAARKPASNAKPATARPHFSRPATHSRDRKPAQSSSSSRPARRTSSDSRSAASRTSGSHAGSGSRPASGARWSSNAPAGAKAGHNGNGNGNGKHAGNGAGRAARSTGNGPRSGGSTPRPLNGTSGTRTAKSSPPGWSQRNGNSNGAKAAGKPGSNGRSGSISRNGSPLRKEARPDARPSLGTRKPSLAAGAKAGNSKQYGFSARPKQETKKRG